MDSTLDKIKSIKQGDLEEYNKYSMLGSGQHGICFSKGRGVRLYDLEGKSYIDCTSQGWALFLGHANEEIRQAVYEQMGELGHLNQNSDSLPRYALAKRLADLAPANLNRVLFTVGGSAAIEAAMKIAAKNVKGARKFVCLQDGYHGTSLTTGAASWISTKAAGIFTGFNSFSGIINDLFIRVPNPYVYRWAGSSDPEGCVDYCLKAAAETLRAGVCGPVAGIIVEPLQASGGQIPLPRRYLQGLRQLCDEFGCLLIFDELQTFCRIGDYFAATKYEVEPDIICIGKSLGAGFPIAAIIIHDRLEGFGPLGEDIHTFSNNGVAQVAALKQLDIVERDRLLEHVSVLGAHFAARLEALKKAYPCIGDVRQAGLHIGIEFVEDPATKAPDMVLAQTVKHAAQAMGLLLGEAGYRLNVLKIKPPFIMTAGEADEALAIFEAALKAALQKKQ
ncbi:4-aminobutyrate aminotransferase [Sporobacter termitidis DSM 10068]|uniref:4-aminobutyrate aminotransferase n=1 Tax=Sporobacter termitidis DSM 10068 TaxID=1123282 RepID=A0A1M5YFQ8_9FIRM|nr:aspartate aminotransferase family protein [Sporobacter termitidis]SHI10739.1 4-aminobutyrate aminotransferase [Sporobacter termitidis DSM 10068]